MDESYSARTEWRQHWPLVLASMIGMSFYSVASYSLGTFIEPLEREFGWSRAQISSGLTVFTMTAIFGAPLMGAAIDRLGTRRIALCGLACHAAAFAALGLTSGSMVQWLCLWAALGLAALTTKVLIWSAAVSSVFTASRGMALAVMLSGTAFAQMLAPFTTLTLIVEFGWRRAYFFLGLGWGGLALLLTALFFFDARERWRREPSTNSRKSAPALGGLSLRQAVRDPRILRIGLAEVFVSSMASGVLIHMVPILSDAGVDRARAVEIAAIAGISGISGKLLVGWLLDRVKGSTVPFLSFAIQAPGYFLLLNTFGSQALLMTGVAVIGFAVGACLQVTTYLVSRYAGLRDFGKIFGCISSMMMVGASCGPLLAGYIYDSAGSYIPLLTTAIPVVLASSLLFLRLGPYPNFNSDAERHETIDAEVRAVVR